MVSAQLEESLRRDIESYIEGRLSGVKQEIAALQSQLNESLSQLLDRQVEVQLDGGVGASIVDHLRAAHEEGIDLAASESSRAKASSDLAIIKAAISEIDQQQSQSEILKVLVNRAAAFAPRVAFFVIKGDQAIGWRARGLEGTVGDSAVQQIKLALNSDTAIGNVARSRETWSGGAGSHAESHLLLNHLGEQSPSRVVSVPLVVRNRSVAVLYADSGDLDSEAINLEALETLVRVAGMAVELLVARSGSATATAPAAPAMEPAPAAESTYQPTVEYGEVTPVVEESAPASVPGFEPATEVQPEAAPPSQPQMPQWPPASEQVSQAPIADPFAQTTPSAAAEVPAQAPRRRYGADVELPVEVANDEERRFHTDARRFARLLVSEIKLYKESQVNEGRSRNDLYDRLREDIERSREMYDKRVKPEVAQRYDYFHHELVNTLAEGDAAKLGNSYPGATVSA
ncbi:MAG TPA: hypothetical protein VJT50_07930 [Pyrinomonadaceae bacterium]|nr:hypothetical protein [Pyrinomonadaceae bacterium]